MSELALVCALNRVILVTMLLFIGFLFTTLIVLITLFSFSYKSSLPPRRVPKKPELNLCIAPLPLDRLHAFHILHYYSTHLPWLLTQAGRRQVTFRFLSFSPVMRLSTRTQLQLKVKQLPWASHDKDTSSDPSSIIDIHLCKLNTKKYLVWKEQIQSTMKGQGIE